jgi:hypothetical protein
VIDRVAKAVNSFPEKFGEAWLSCMLLMSQGDGSYPLADVFNITYGSTGTATLTLQGGAFGISGVRVIAADDTVAGEIETPKISRRTDTSTTFSATSGATASIYVDRTGRSESEYRVTIAVA